MTCSNWLWNYITDSSTVFIPVEEVLVAGKAEGFLKDEIKQARKELGIGSISNPNFVEQGGRSFWFIPPWLEGFET